MCNAQQAVLTSVPETLLRGDTETIRTQREARGNQSLLCKLQMQAEVKTQQRRARISRRGTNAASWWSEAFSRRLLNAFWQLPLSLALLDAWCNF